MLSSTIASTRVAPRALNLSSAARSSADPTPVRLQVRQRFLAAVGEQYGEMLARRQRAQAKLTAVNAAVLAAFTATAGSGRAGYGTKIMPLGVTTPVMATLPIAPVVRLIVPRKLAG